MHKNQSEKFIKIISKAAQFLCKSHENCSWGTTRTSGMTIWTLCECGLAKTHGEFITHCLRELVNNEIIADEEKGLWFNSEVWDTSIALIALCRAARQLATQEFDNKIKLIKKRLVTEIREDNVNNEPWETMWAVMALLEFEHRDDDPETIELIKRCITWVLERRNKAGILISPHYMGFLLSILNYSVYSKALTDVEKEEYQEPVNKCNEYLHDEFINSKDKGLLWSNEPWSIGHILLGISSSPQIGMNYYKDIKFNEYLLNWYQKEWDHEGGWVDLLDTSCTLLGLMNYYHNREIYLNYGRLGVDSESVENISSRIKFKYKDTSSKKLVVYPLWETRGMQIQKKEVFVIMPFKENWSDEVYKYIEKILKSIGFIVSRADKKVSRKSLEKIWVSINTAEIIIADITNDNPNVLYELGIAHTIGKNVLIISQDRNKIPFNLKISDVIQYNYSPSLYPQLKGDILKAIESFKSETASV